MLFSQRMGLKPESKLTQRESIDDELRNKLWNVLIIGVWDFWEPASQAYDMHSRSDEAKEVDKLMRSIWFTLLKLPLDRLPEFDPRRGSDSGYGVLRERVMTAIWHDVFDLIEFIAKNLPRRWGAALRDKLNAVLEQENSAYRFIDFTITEITDQNEIDAVEEAAAENKKTVSAHLKRALELLTDRKTPDYRNSMKESISAVEAVCQEITGKPGATLNQCIAAIKTKRTLHPAFEGSLVKLFGFTSDSGGIRHAMTDETERPTFADAKYMLVTCSAVTNYFRTLQAE
jgi:hypothetical protein